MTKQIKKSKPKAKPKLKLKAKSEPNEKAKTGKNAKKYYRTGEKCPESGLYSHYCREKREKSSIPLSKTETFPPCRTCGSVRWTLVMAA